MEFKTYLRILVNRWWIILPSFLITFIATVVFTYTQPVVYRATATYVVRVGLAFQDDRGFVSALDTLSRRVEIASTYAEVTSSRMIKNQAADALGLSLDQSDKLSVNSRLIAGTNILEITVEGNDPVLVRDFTNAVGVQTIAYVRKLYETYELEPLDQAALPESPVKPDKVLILSLGGLFGLILGVGLALITEYLETSPEPTADSMSLQSEAEAHAPGQLVVTLQQELALLQAQFEVTQHRFEQAQATLFGAAEHASLGALDEQAVEPDTSRQRAVLTEMIQQLQVTQERLAELQYLTQNYRAEPAAAGAPSNGRQSS